MNKSIACEITDSSEIEIYDCYVTNLADLRSGELISNGQIEHAQSIIRNLFSHAEKEVRIFTACLHPGIYNDIRMVDAASSFLAKNGAQVKILIQDIGGLDKSTPFFRLCAEHTDQCSMKSVVDERDKSIKQHMVVMDTSGFRFCADMKKNEAIASFNSPDTAKNLAEQFDILFHRASELNTVAESALSV
ncbi:MAG: hypothetical protein K0M48_14395 [Thiobacillus sp.]|nr:hypothetical protein [Thiobacillus sp.]